MLAPVLAPAPTLAAWFHDLDPVILPIAGSLAVRWYGVSYLLGFVLAYLVLRALAARGLTPIPRDRIADAMLLLVLGVMAGGRLGYALLYEPAILVEFSASPPFWSLLALNRGGMASHGGFVGVILAAWWISRGFKDDHGNRVGACPPLHVMDMCALVAPIGLTLGRIANFINGELLGRVVAAPGQPAPWYAVRYPQEIIERPLDRLPHTDDQLDRIVELSMTKMLPGETDWMLGYQRVLESIQRGDAALKAQLEPLISARYPTQLLQAFFDGVLVLIVVWIIARRPRVPGVIGAWMLMVYALGRIAMDWVRLPDAGITQFGPLTRGQLYSLLMLVVAVAVLLWTRRASAPAPMGGWGVRHPAPGAGGSDADPSSGSSGSSGSRAVRVLTEPRDPQRRAEPHADQQQRAADLTNPRRVRALRPVLRVLGGAHRLQVLFGHELALDRLPDPRRHPLAERVQPERGRDDQPEQETKGRAFVPMKHPAQQVRHPDHPDEHPDPDRDNDPHEIHQRGQVASFTAVTPSLIAAITVS